MNEIHYVNTGEVKLGNKSTILNSGAIGSCVVVCMYNSLEEKGAMAHIMLPDVAPEGKESKNTRYAANAIRELCRLMKKEDGQEKELKTFIVGGANVLKRPNDTISKKNIDSVEKLLYERGIRITRKAVGGYERRTAVFDIENACINYTEGDSKARTLWLKER